MLSQRLGYVWWEMGSMLVVFRYLKNCHLREEIIIVCCSEGTRPWEGVWADSLGNLDIYHHMF